MQDREGNSSGRLRGAGILLIVCAAVLGATALAAFLSKDRPSPVFAALGAPPGSGTLENFRHRDQDGMTAEQDHGEFATAANHDRIMAFYRNACRRNAWAVVSPEDGSLPLGFARSQLVCRGHGRGERYTAAIDTGCDSKGCGIFIEVVTD